MVFHSSSVVQTASQQVVALELQATETAGEKPEGAELQSAIEQHYQEANQEVGLQLVVGPKPVGPASQPASSVCRARVKWTTN